MGRLRNCTLFVGLAVWGCCKLPILRFVLSINEVAYLLQVNKEFSSVCVARGDGEVVIGLEGFLYIPLSQSRINVRLRASIQKSK